ncbi:hypothetical protein PHLGIDRAFT_130450 [Phlebiopsis gigantea 11061_1 CR5-6]|uniref:F-box domain-containing protein n=1 Tax=Phlebiopsis gigantea (strain 11061_1 CR5-6) TaxID=745531 RepID=A0A0C3S162_PHLG1|nr:hypothetical protein PHLGIDRAFT_130450 [Phlebiopsis gigantea 11061_1 CR5-6]
MPSIAALPQELVDHIIDDIGPSDKRAAASLTLTCNAWTSRSSKHLFNTVNVFTAELPEFLAQAAGSSRLASHVTELTISQPMRGDDGFDLTPFVPAILHTLPRLSALSVFGERISVQAGLPAPPAGQRRTLALLRLSHTHIEALPELLQLFDTVDTLHLDQVYIPPCAVEPAPAPPARHLRVRALFFDGSRPTFEALSALLQRDVLQYLHLKCDIFFRIHTEPVNAFLHEVGAALEHFRFDLPMDGWVVDGPGTPSPLPVRCIP